MPVARAFARCSECGHAGVMRVASACGLCGGPIAVQRPPTDLFTAWRCDCYHCASTPC